MRNFLLKFSYGVIGAALAAGAEALKVVPTTGNVLWDQIIGAVAIGAGVGLAAVAKRLVARSK